MQEVQLPADQSHAVEKKGAQTSLALSETAVSDMTTHNPSYLRGKHQHLIYAALVYTLLVSEDLKYKWESASLFLLHPTAQLALVPI